MSLSSQPSAKTSRRRGSLAFMVALAIPPAAAALAAPLIITAAPVYADPTPTPGERSARGYPSWDDVEKAKANEQSKQEQVDRITALIASLTQQVEEQYAAAALATEHYQEASDNLRDAAERSNKLKKNIEKNKEELRKAQEQAAELVGAMHHGTLSGGSLGIFFGDSAVGGSDSTAGSTVNGAQSEAEAAAKTDQMLSQLSYMDKLGERSKAIQEQALETSQAAQKLQEQADRAQEDYQRLAEAAQAALEAADASRIRYEAAKAEQEEQSRIMIAQLAVLQGTTEEVQRKYVQGVELRREQERQAREAERQRQLEAQARAQAAASGGRGSRGGSAPGAEQAAVRNLPANSSVVQRVLAFAHAVIGRPYHFGGSGGGAGGGYDCSGLTLRAYATAGINLGGHSVNRQYYKARSQGQLVAYGNAQPGDLVFFGGGPGSFYHVGIYVGGGQMIDAPYEGKPIQKRNVWSGGRWWQVARPSA